MCIVCPIEDEESIHRGEMIPLFTISSPRPEVNKFVKNDRPHVCKKYAIMEGEK
jgi:hypothetical protein